MKQIEGIRNAWREAFQCLLEKCNVAKDDIFDEKKFLVEAPWYSNPLAVLNRYLLCGPSLTEDDLNDSSKLAKLHDKLCGLRDTYWDAHRNSKSKSTKRKPRRSKRKQTKRNERLMKGDFTIRLIIVLWI